MDLLLDKVLSNANLLQMKNFLVASGKDIFGLNALGCSVTIHMNSKGVQLCFDTQPLVFFTVTLSYEEKYQLD